MSNAATGADARSASDAGPLGHLALGLTLLSYGLLATGTLSGAGVRDAVALAHLVGGLTLFLTGFWQLRNGDTFTGTAFAGLGAFWAAWSAGGDVGRHASGLFQLVWAMLALTLTAASWKSGMLSRALYGLLTLSLLLGAIGTLGSSGSAGKIGGWLAAAAGVAAWYGATAALTNSGWGRAVLPLK